MAFVIRVEHDERSSACQIERDLFVNKMEDIIKMKLKIRCNVRATLRFAHTQRADLLSVRFALHEATISLSCPKCLDPVIETQG